MCLVHQVYIYKSRDGTNSPSVAQKRLRGERVGALFKWQSFCVVVINVGPEIWMTFVEGKRAILLYHRHCGLPWSSTKSDSCKFGLVPARTACFLKKHFRIDLGLGAHVHLGDGGQPNSAGLLAFTSFSCLFQRVKAMAGHLSALQHPCQVEERLCPQTALRRQTSTKTSSNHRRRRSCQILVEKRCLASPSYLL